MEMETFISKQNPESNILCCVLILLTKFNSGLGVGLEFHSKALQGLTPTPLLVFLFSFFLSFFLVCVPGNFTKYTGGAKF